MKRTMLAATLAALSGARPAAAHHSYGAYYEKETVSIEGTIETIRFANPASHTITLLREIQRPADGWRWRRTTRQ